MVRYLMLVVPRHWWTSMVIGSLMIKLQGLRYLREIILRL